MSSWKHARVGRIAQFAAEYPFSVAALVNAHIFIVIAATRGFVFETVDDYNVMMTLNGDKTCSPYWQVTFFNSILAFFLTILYRIIPFIQWYTLLQILAMFISLTILLRILIEEIDIRDGSILLGIFLYVVVFVVAFLYPVRHIQFTTTAGLLGMASCALLVRSRHEFEIIAASRMRMKAGMLLFASFAIRRSAGICVSAFFAVVLLWLGFEKYGVKVRQWLVGYMRNVLRELIIPIALICVFVGGHLLVLHLGANSNYVGYDKWRAQFQDHPHAQYVGNEELYESVGWTKLEYDLAESLIYLGDFINGSAFKTISQSPQTKAVQNTFTNAIKQYYKVIKSNLAGVSLAACTIAFMCSTLLMLSSLWIANKRETLYSFILVLGISITSVALGILLCLQGRWMLRLFQVVTFPCIGVLIPVFLEAMNLSLSQQKMQNAVSSRVAAGLCIFLLIIGWAFNHAENYDQSLVKNEKYSIEQMRSVEQYAIENPDKLFVHDYSISNYYDKYDPFRSYVNAKPHNLIISGGSYTYSGAYWNQLSSNNLTMLNADTLLSENVFYICDRTRANGVYTKRVLWYIRTTHPEARIKKVGELSNHAHVYKYYIPNSQ